jgi:endonuclease-3
VATKTLDRRARKARAKKDAPKTLARLAEIHPEAHCELDHRTPFELLCSVVLSAQTTDVAVNKITPALFAKYPDAPAMAKAEPRAIEALINRIGMFRQKAKNLVGLSRALVDEHGGEVPRSLEALVALPGVGRKTANVVLGHALGVPGLPVDRHVLRVANRLGIAHSDDAVAVERQLTAALPPERWTRASDTLILHGRRVCRPKPLCDRCSVRDMCAYVRRLGPTAPRRPALRPKRLGAAKRPRPRKPGS